MATPPGVFAGCCLRVPGSSPGNEEVAGVCQRAMPALGGGLENKTSHVLSYIFFANLLKG